MYTINPIPKFRPLHPTDVLAHAIVQPIENIEEMITDPPVAWEKSHPVFSGSAIINAAVAKHWMIWVDDGLYPSIPGFCENIRNHPIAIPIPLDGTALPTNPIVYFLHNKAIPMFTYFVEGTIPAGNAPHASRNGDPAGKNCPHNSSQGEGDTCTLSLWDLASLIDAPSHRVGKAGGENSSVVFCNTACFRVCNPVVPTAGMETPYVAGLFLKAEISDIIYYGTGNIKPLQAYAKLIGVDLSKGD